MVLDSLLTQHQAFGIAARTVATTVDQARCSMPAQASTRKTSIAARRCTTLLGSLHLAARHGHAATLRALVEARRAALCVAFAMARHPRLGAGTAARGLEAGLVREVLTLAGFGRGGGERGRRDGNGRRSMRRRISMMTLMMMMIGSGGGDKDEE